MILVVVLVIGVFVFYLCVLALVKNNMTGTEMSCRLEFLLCLALTLETKYFQHNMVGSFPLGLLTGFFCGNETMRR